MSGMDRLTGKPLGGDAHLRQSISDILSTRVGTRVGRREYGSLVPDLVDQPMNDAGVLRLFAAVALALLRWEPRIRLKKVAIVRNGDAGSYALQLDAERTDSRNPNNRTQLTVPLGRAIAFA